MERGLYAHAEREEHGKDAGRKLAPHATAARRSIEQHPPEHEAERQRAEKCRGPQIELIAERALGMGGDAENRKLKDPAE